VESGAHLGMPAYEETVALYHKNHQGNPAAAPLLSNPAVGIEPIERRAVYAGVESWRVDDLTSPVARRRQIEIAVLITGLEKALLDTSVEIKR
jgi:hypothetical protein